MNVFDIASQCGIQFDSFGVPVVDKKSMLEAFAKKVIQASTIGLDKSSLVKIQENVKLMKLDINN
jgi:hypothetical protein